MRDDVGKVMMVAFPRKPSVLNRCFVSKCRQDPVCMIVIPSPGGFFYRLRCFELTGGLAAAYLFNEAVRSDD
jgi:hypothetical protein